LALKKSALMVNSRHWPILIMGSRVALPPIELDPREDTQVPLDPREDTQVELQDANPLELDEEEDSQVPLDPSDSDDSRWGDWGQGQPGEMAAAAGQGGKDKQTDSDDDRWGCWTAAGKACQVPLQDANKDELQMRWSGFIPGSREDGDANISKTVHKKTDNNKRQKLELPIPDDDATEVADDALLQEDQQLIEQLSKKLQKPQVDPESERNDVILMKCLLKQAKWKYQGKRVDQRDAPFWFRQNQVAGSPDQTSATETEWDGNEKYEPQGRSPSSSEETL
jgi:hypothetical protein